MEEKHYVVTWSIDALASTPFDAAMIALNTMVNVDAGDPNSACVFDVRDVAAGESTLVDVAEGRPFSVKIEVHTPNGPVQHEVTLYTGMLANEFSGDIVTYVQEEFTPQYEWRFV